LAGFLVSYEASELGTFWPVYQGRMVIGRKGAASDLDIEVDHPTTSSRHASLEVTARPGRIVLEDLGSTNGTFYGDSKLERGRPIQIRDGDTIRLGGYPVIVKIV
jgi:pSer/pThr/pTyr-binding forkhead associated (FHA) protein